MKAVIDLKIPTNAIQQIDEDGVSYLMITIPDVDDLDLDDAHEVMDMLYHSILQRARLCEDEGVVEL